MCTDNEMPIGWKIKICEISANVYCVKASGPNGELFEKTSSEIDLNNAISECRIHAMELGKKH